MSSHEHTAENFAATIQMMQIRAAEAAACITVAVSIDRYVGIAVLRIADLQHTERSEQIAVARITRRQHTIEHVDAESDRRDEIGRRTDAHQIPRLLHCELRHQIM